MNEHIALWYFFHNKIVGVTFFGWLAAQTIKVLVGLFRERRFNFKWFVGTGGMPSSHAAGATALATAIGIQEGVHTAIFVVALMFAVVIVVDAQGVRRAAGKQAEILNKIVDDIYWKRDVKEDRLKELLGHTPVQVIAGVVVGLVVAFLAYLK